MVSVKVRLLVDSPVEGDMSWMKKYCTNSLELIVLFLNINAGTAIIV